MFMDRVAWMRNTLSVLLVSIIISGSVSASTSHELFFLDTFQIEDADSGTRTLEMDVEGNIFASFGDSLYKLSPTGEVLHERIFSTEISATSISPDDSKIALTLKSGTIGIDSIYVLSTGDLSTLVSDDVTQTNAYILQWSPNGAEIYTNAPDAGILQLNRDTLVEESSYVGNHTGTMACVDVSASSGTVLTADNEGLIQLWSNNGEDLLSEIRLQTVIHDCKIGDADEFFSISTPNNGIRKWTFSGSELKPIDIDAAIHYEFSNLPNTIIVHKESPMPHFLSYDYLNEQIMDTTSVFHSFDDYVLKFDDQYHLKNIYLNTRVDYIVKYGAEVHRIGIGESGIDTDGDGIPDSLDSDDDGDGIEDNWDLNCPDVGIQCDLLPDENYIRSIDFEMNNTNLVVKQSFTLSKKHSTSIRDLSRLSLDSDIKLIESEAQLFADSICSNMDEEKLSTEVSSALDIGNITLTYSEMYCSIEDGMVLYPASDQTSHIRYSIHMIYDLNSTQSMDGAVVEVVNHRFPSSGSITELSEQHPLSIKIHGEQIDTQEYVPWHIQEGQVSFTLNEKKQQTDQLDPTSIASSPVMLLVIIVGLGGVIFVGILVSKRQSDRSSYDIVLDDEEEDEEDEEESEEEDFYEEYSEEDVFVEDDEKNTSPETVTNSNSTAQRKKPPAKRVRVPKQESDHAKKLLQDSSNEVVRKRRARRSEHDTVKTKRRKLSDSHESRPQPRKRRAVQPSQKSEDQMDETLKRFVSDSPEE